MICDFLGSSDVEQQFVPSLAFDSVLKYAFKTPCYIIDINIHFLEKLVSG